MDNGGKIGEHLVLEAISTQPCKRPCNQCNQCYPCSPITSPSPGTLLRNTQMKTIPLCLRELENSPGCFLLGKLEEMQSSWTECGYFGQQCLTAFVSPLQAPTLCMHVVIEKHDTSWLLKGENPVWSHYHLPSKEKSVLDKPVHLGWTGDSESVRKWRKPLLRDPSVCFSSALRKTSGCTSSALGSLQPCKQGGVSSARGQHTSWRLQAHLFLLQNIWDRSVSQRVAWEGWWEILDL